MQRSLPAGMPAQAAGTAFYQLVKMQSIQLVTKPLSGDQIALDL